MTQWVKAPKRSNSRYWKPLNEGDSIEGKLMDIQDVEGKFGTQTIYIVKTNEGKEVIVNGCKSLNEQIFDIESNTSIKIVFMGSIQTSRGKTMKNFDVFFDKDVPF